MVLTFAEKTELQEQHWEALDDTVQYWPATDTADTDNAYKPAFAAKQGDYDCTVLDRAGFAGDGGFIDLDPNATYRTLVLRRTAPRPKGADRYWWPSASQWLEVVRPTPPGSNGPVLYVTTKDITLAAPA